MIERGVAKAACAMLLRNGYHGTSVRMLAGELGETTQDIYTGHGGKAACVLELLRHEEACLQTLCETAAVGDRPAREQLKAWLDDLAREQIANGPPPGLLCVNLPCQLGPGEDDLRSEAARVHDRLIRWIAGLIRSIERTGPRAGDREIAEFVLAAVVGSIVLAVTDRDQWELANGLSRLKDYIDTI